MGDFDGMFLQELKPLPPPDYQREWGPVLFVPALRSIPGIPFPGVTSFVSDSDLRTDLFVAIGSAAARLPGVFKHADWLKAPKDLSVGLEEILSSALAALRQSPGSLILLRGIDKAPLREDGQFGHRARLLTKFLEMAHSSAALAESAIVVTTTQKMLPHAALFSSSLVLDVTSPVPSILKCRW